ncbi:hypothetical protein Egran_04584 [Elaphomyces granulatus]|uniref:Transcription regulator Rua1 C-terminal domain-containing protein n=1 Tax=Elaphomyces granulatus TaxID=519963 RepID=A0A232LU04_9EURO|nr:hypothetical protein Egran_04584 [Elaphomyces granulatus]
MSTTATMESLGIRIRQPGVYPNVSLVAHLRGLPEQTFNQSPLSWYSHHVDTAQDCAPSTYMGNVSGLVYPDYVDRSRCGLEAVGGSLDGSNLDPFQNKTLSAHVPPALNGMEGFPSKLDLESFLPDDGFCESQPECPISLSGNEIGPFDPDGFPEAMPFHSDYSQKTHVPLSTIADSPAAPLESSSSKAPKIDRRLKSCASSRPNMRTAPYRLDGIRKRWLSTTPHTSPSAKPPSSLSYEDDGNLIHTTSVNSSHSSGGTSISNSVPFNQAITPVVGSSPSRVYGEPFLEPSRSNHHGRKPSRLFPQECCQTIGNSVDLGGRCFDHHSGPSSPPDLLGPLREEPIAPPAQDMNPDNPDLVPHEQEQRFENDLYTPKWVRGQGYKREGWCGICRPGRWLVLKNSAFWYDKSFTHGVSASTGQAFDAPKETRRMADSPDTWEGLCRRCGEWIALVSSKKKGTTWFRHAHKCQIHARSNKGSPKKRRGSNSNSNSTANHCPDAIANFRSPSSASLSSMMTESTSLLAFSAAVEDTALSTIDPVSTLIISPIN